MGPGVPPGRQRGCGCASTSGQQSCINVLAARYARSFASTSSLDRRGSRECRVRAAPAVSCARCTKRCAHEHTGSAEQSGIPCATVLRLMPCSPRRRIHFVTVAAGLMTDNIRLDRYRHRQLDISNGCQDHTVLPYALAPFVLRAVARSRKTALRTHLAPTLPRPPHPLPRS